MKALFLLLLGSVLLLGCSSLSTQRDAGISQLKHIYVEHLISDNYRLDESMVTELKALGYDASSGPLTMMPDGTDAIITYQERSAWDFKSYLIELNVAVRANFTDKPLAAARYYQPSMRTKSPADVVHEVITSIFKHG